MFNIIKNFKVLDLFSGAGGISCGLHMNPNFETSVALDNNKYATETFQKNMPNTKVIMGDITDEIIRKQVISECKNKCVNMIVGGPPCQGYSLKGKNLGLLDDRNFLFIEYLKIVSEIQPEVFVIENVKNLLSSAKGWFKDEIVKSITDLGYIVNYGILNASDFGVPQKRERSIFICSRTKNIELPIGDKIKKVTVRDAISDLAYLESGEGFFESEYKYSALSEYQKTMRMNSIKLYNHQATKHSEIALNKLKLIPSECGKESLPKEMWGNQIFSSTWGRLKWNTVSPTIDTRFDTPSNGTNSHPILHRSITAREAARLQSFPDNFIFYGGRRQVCKQIGNAVPPLMAKAIGDKICEYYINEKCDNSLYDIK